MNTIGIDFGTTKTLVATFNKKSSKPEPIRLGRSSYEVPTTIHVDIERQFLFGEDADDQLAYDPGGYVRRVKRDLGSAKENVLNGNSITSVELSSKFLGYIKNRVESEYFHEKIDQAVITVPAKFGPAAREDVEIAANDAGFKSFILLDEPIAAGIAFLEEKQSTKLGEEILVFDWGGGTLDIAFVEMINGEWKLHHDLLEGDPNLGGEDIDDALLDAINLNLNKSGYPVISRNNKKDYPMLIRRLLEMKILLSKKKSHSITQIFSNGLKFEFPCTRENFEVFISNELDRAFQCFANWEKKAGSVGKCPKNILLIGGTSQIPVVAKRLAGHGKEVLLWNDSVRAVALGAAVYADRTVSRSVAKSLKPNSPKRKKIKRESKKKQLVKEEPPLPITINVAAPDDGLILIAPEMELIDDDYSNWLYQVGPDIQILNISNRPLKFVKAKVYYDDNLSHDFNVIAKTLKPNEYIYLTMANTNYNFKEGDILEISCQGLDYVITQDIERADCELLDKPLLPILAAWTPGILSGRVLHLWCYESRTVKVTLKDAGDNWNCTVKVSNNNWTRVGWRERSDSCNFTAEEAFEILSKGYAPSVCIFANR